MNFDEIIDRSSSWAAKWVEVNHDEDKPAVIPLWVADMDFPGPKAVAEALEKRAAHPAYGYTRVSPGYFEALVCWYSSHYGVDLQAGDFMPGPGVVPSIGVTVRALSRPGDGVLIFTPVYGPFFDMILHNGRVPVEAPMSLDEKGRYHFTEAVMETALAAARKEGRNTPLILVSSPHNPGGAVWEREELALLLAFARKEKMRVIFDEIHSDFVFPPKTFTTAAAFPDYADTTVILSGANKSFNLGGLQGSHFVVRDAGLKTAVKEDMRSCGFSIPSIFNLTAVEAAYRSGGPWLSELTAYIRRNIEEAVSALNAGIPGARAYLPEGTYLIWADMAEPIRRLGLKDDRELALRLENQGRVKITAGSGFGKNGASFIRINTACPRVQLMEGIARIIGFSQTAG